MADRPRGNGGPQEGTPEYDWLYGSKRRGASAPSDDATRMLPAEQRHARAASASGAAAGGANRPPTRPAPPPVAPPPDGGGSGFRPRLRLRWVKYAVLLWLVFLLAVPFWAWTRVNTVEAFPADGRPGDQPGTTYLVVGTDQASDLTDEQRRQVRPGERDSQRTDTIMVLHVGRGPNLLLSIPRDSIVDIPGRGSNKINASYAFGGPELLVRTVEQNTGIHIDHYVEIGFGGVINLVDAVGGIEICPERRMQDPDARLNIRRGCQEVDGTTALAYARSRKTSGLGDIERAKNQREVVSAVGSKAISPWSVINPVRWYRLNTAAAGSLGASEGTSAIAMGRFAWAITRVDGDRGLTCGVPIRDLGVNWDPERSERMFELIRSDRTGNIGNNLCTPSGLPR